MIRFLFCLRTQIISFLAGEEMGFLICVDMEHSGVAHARELLHQDCDIHRTNLSQETAGEKSLMP